MGDFTLQNIKENEVLSAVNFIKNSDTIYVATLTEEQILELDIGNYKVLEKSNDNLTILNLEFSISENTKIYCHSDYIESLFDNIRDLNFKNLKLITSQSDRKVSRNLFKLKPECISKWYAVNVDYINNNLVPIPLGLASFRNTKCVIATDFFPFENIKKSKFLYVNFNLNTNYLHRFNAKKYALSKLNVHMASNMDYEKYISILREHKFILCPWGNGFDTHRFWEAIYAGSIPVTKDHNIFKSFYDIPMVLIKNYKRLNNLKNINLSKNFNYSKLQISWWVDMIDSTKVVSNEQTMNFNLSTNDIEGLLSHVSKLKAEQQRIKNLKTFIRKVYSKINIFHKT